MGFIDDVRDIVDEIPLGDTSDADVLRHLVRRHRIAFRGNVEKSCPCGNDAARFGLSQYCTAGVVRGSGKQGCVADSHDEGQSRRDGLSFLPEPSTGPIVWRSSLPGKEFPSIPFIPTKVRPPGSARLPHLIAARFRFLWRPILLRAASTWTEFRMFSTTKCRMIPKATSIALGGLRGLAPSAPRCHSAMQPRFMFLKGIEQLTGSSLTRIEDHPFHSPMIASLHGKRPSVAVAPGAGLLHGGVLGREAFTRALSKARSVGRSMTAPGNEYLLWFCGQLWRRCFQRLAQFPDLFPVMQLGFALPVMTAFIAVDFGHIESPYEYFGK